MADMRMREMIIGSREAFAGEPGLCPEELETVVMEICEQATGLITKALDDARRAVSDATFRASYSRRLSDEQMAVFADHLSDCVNTTLQVKCALSLMELAVGAGWCVAASCEDLPGRDVDSPMVWITMSAPVECDAETKAIIRSVVAPITVDLYRESQAVWLTRRGAATNRLGPEKMRLVADGVKLRLYDSICDVVAFDALGDTLTGVVESLPHQGCVDRIVAGQPVLVG